jgi:hypothetical protein
MVLPDRPPAPAAAEVGGGVGGASNDTAAAEDPRAGLAAQPAVAPPATAADGVGVLADASGSEVPELLLQRGWGAG